MTQLINKMDFMQIIKIKLYNIQAPPSIPLMHTDTTFLRSDMITTYFGL